MKCPKCRVHLTEKTIGKIILDQCEQCEGIWFDSRELASYRGLLGLKEKPTEYHWEFSEKTTSSNLECPRCVSLSLNFGEFHGYRLHHCSECYGFFLSSDTVNEIIQYTKSRSVDPIAGLEIVPTVFEFLARFLWVR